MSIWNKVLIGLIILASLGFFYLAMRTLKTHQNWRAKAQQLEKKIKDLQRDNRLLLKGQGEDPDNEGYAGGIERLKLDLRKITAGRGRVWTDCKPQGGPQTQQTGQVGVATVARGIGQKTVLYVFDATDVLKGGRYLGEFKVLAVDEANGLLQLQPAMTPTPEEIQRIAASAAANAAWTMYEIMPADNHRTFTELKEDRFKELWPPGSPHEQEYVNDGKPATWGKMEQWAARGALVDQEGKPLVDQQGQPVETAEGTYQRWLRDYDVLLKDYRLQRSKLLDLKDAAAQDLADVQTALAEADKHQKYREREVALLTTQKQQHDSQRAATYELLERLTEDVKALHGQIAALIAENLALAAQIDQIQQDAKRRIDARTSGMAQSGTGGN